MNAMKKLEGVLSLINFFNYYDDMEFGGLTKKEKFKRNRLYVKYARLSKEAGLR